MVQRPIVVLMGVSGSGKSTVAAVLAARLGWVFQEGDELHSAANVAKMTSGRALTDEDRWGWLRSVSDWIEERIVRQEPAIVTCSALKRSYRDVLRRPGVVFVLLAVSEQILRERLAVRRGHYMPESLLPTQLSTLELPTSDENVVVVSGESPPSAVADEIVHRLGLDV